MSLEYSVWSLQPAPFGGLVAIDQGGLVMTKAEVFDLLYNLSEFLLRFDDEEIIQANQQWTDYKTGSNPILSLTPLEAITGIINRPSFTQAPLTTNTTKYVPSKKGYVYLLQGGPYYKIGHTAHLQQRMEQIKPKLPFETSLLCTIATDDRFALETELHQEFANKRVNGEWFELTQDDIEYIKELAQ